jgi:TRAP-type C4-dicarboxylate transport system permease small subunit
VAAFETLLSLLERGAMLVARLLAVVIVVVLGAQVFCRFVLNQSLIWSEEVATWSMIWVVFMGSAALMRRWEHVHVPMFVNLLPRRLRLPILLLGRIAALVCVGMLAVYGLQVFEGRFHFVSQTTGLSTRWIKLSLPIGMALMTLFAASLVIRDLRAWLSGELPPPLEPGVGGTPPTGASDRL